VIFARLKAGIAIAAVLAIVGLSWGIKHQTDRLTEMTSARDAALLAAEQNARVVAQVREQRDRDIADLDRLSSRLRRERDAARTAIEQLEELKRNEAMVQADPAGAERLINERLRRLFDVLSCASGRTGGDCPSPAVETGATATP
jgi:hypothetical protein